ncbi:N-acetylmannosamine kinase [Photobacterium atrarenae]|uniref:N-acetylmannosamine kinase n=1 Tax=Photobacterium atrarenae TaxID=865757 RepID=A0ABY5GMR9_9GAMM|nr:N-acetylmannosamine kinase [Photobacterium atrarenae]UTV30575.1 N-acetylmannosamine kinase [Photobacterium atrarenae]
MNVLAIDIGGTKVALGLLQAGVLTERKQIPTPVVTAADAFADEILQACRPWLAQADCIGVSTTGVVTEAGITAINPVTLAFPAPFPLQTALQSQTQLPVRMLNDAQAAAWYEYQRLDGKYRNMAYLTVSTGIGGGLVIDGNLHTGAQNFAGHIGHTVIDRFGPPCGCGQTGCVEATASGTAIQTLARKLISPSVSNPELFDMAPEHTQAEAIIQNSARAVATLCANLKATLDLEVIVLGGGIGLAAGYLERVKQHLTTKPPFFQVELVAAQGDHDACLLGAAYLHTQLASGA